jgi:hypothetical protein
MQRCENQSDQWVVGNIYSFQLILLLFGGSGLRNGYINGTVSDKTDHAGMKFIIW